MHHIISDGWSMGVLVGELPTLYEAFARGTARRCASCPIQYADFAVWQRSVFQGEVLAAQIAYWKRQLARRPAVLELPTDRPRPPAQTYRGAAVIRSPLAERLTAALQRAQPARGRDAL